MSLEDPFNTTDCTTTALCFPRLETSSSTSFMYWGQYWTLDAIKNGDGFDISGNLTTTKAGFSADLQIDFPAGCPQGSFGASYEKSPLVAGDQVSMEGHISPQTANVIFTISNLTLRHDGNGSLYQFPGELKFNFTGDWWQYGAGLVTTGQYPNANGVKAAPPQAARTSRTRLAEIIGGSLGGVLILAIATYLCCSWKRPTPIPTPKPPVRNDSDHQLSIYVVSRGSSRDIFTPPPDYVSEYASPGPSKVSKVSKYPNGYAPAGSSFS